MRTLTDTISTSHQIASHWHLDSNSSYSEWRDLKLQIAIDFAEIDSVLIKDLANPRNEEISTLVEHCTKTNMALYDAPNTANAHPDQTRAALRNFSDKMGLKIAEEHRSAGKSGIVALTVSEAPSQKGYLPYSQRPMNWHTDGYYNSSDQQIRAMVLHCVNPANIGGKNQFLDPEIAYIRLRDENPDFISALMHPQAMIIPANLQENGKTRLASIGPVFSFDPTGTNLVMRYTARTRSIEWRQDTATQAAVKFLQNLLEQSDPLTKTTTLKAGQGVLCNNSLHNRTGFDPEKDRSSDRMLFRIRFHNRVNGS